jgi:hypothetical protein
VTAKLGEDVEPLEFAHGFGKGPQADATRGRAVHAPEEKGAPRWRIVSGQGRQFALEMLKPEVDIERRGVLLEKLPGGGEVAAALRYSDDFVHYLAVTIQTGKITGN